MSEDNSLTVRDLHRIYEKMKEASETDPLPFDYITTIKGYDAIIEWDKGGRKGPFPYHRMYVLT